MKLFPQQYWPIFFNLLFMTGNQMDKQAFSQLKDDLAMSSSDFESSSDEENQPPPRSLNVPNNPPPTKKILPSAKRDVVAHQIARRDVEITDAVKKAKNDARSRNRRRDKKNKLKHAEYDTIFRTLGAALEISTGFDIRGKPVEHQSSPGIGKAAEYIRENWAEVKRLRDKYSALSQKPLNRAEKIYKKSK